MVTYRPPSPVLSSVMLSEKGSRWAANDFHLKPKCLKMLLALLKRKAHCIAAKEGFKVL